MHLKYSPSVTKKTKLVQFWTDCSFLQWPLDPGE